MRTPSASTWRGDNTALPGPQLGRPVLVWLLLLAGCDGTPARVKPWRHAPDPKAVADAVPRSAALVREEEDLAVRARRGHTLRIHMDAEPRSLHPLLSPSQWTRRAVVGTDFETLIRYDPPEGGTGAGPGRYLPGL